MSIFVHVNLNGNEDIIIMIMFMEHEVAAHDVIQVLCKTAARTVHIYH